MERVSRGRLRPLLDCIRGVYHLRDLDAFRAHLLSSIPTLIPSEITSFVELDRAPKYWATPPGALRGATGNAWRRLLQQHPVLAFHRETKDGQAVKVSDLVPRAQFQRTALYQEHYRRLNVDRMMGISFIEQSSPTILIGLLRQGRDFSEDERVLLNLLRPHLVQANENARAVTSMRSNQGLLGSPSTSPPEGVLVLGPGHRVKLATRQAREWMTLYFGRLPPRQARGLPERLHTWIAHQHGTLAPADHVPQPREPLVIEREAARLIIRLISDDDGSVLLFTEQHTAGLDPRVGTSGLTRREGQVLTWVAEGKTNAEIGIIIGTGSRTVAKHMEHIFEKLGVETRTAAAAQLLNARAVSRYGGQPD